MRYMTVSTLSIMACRHLTLNLFTAASDDMRTLTVWLSFRTNTEQTAALKHIYTLLLAASSRGLNEPLLIQQILNLLKLCSVWLMVILCDWASALTSAFSFVFWP